MSRRTTDPRVAQLRALPLFEGCTTDELKVINFVTDELRVRAGTTLTRRGEIPRECFLLVSGEAEMQDDGMRVATISAPTLIGAESLQDNSRRTRSVVTTSEATVFAYGVRGFLALMNVPRVAERIRSGAYGAAESLQPVVVPTQATAGRLAPSGAAA